MPLILGGSSAAAAAYSIDNSCRWNDGDSPYMHYTPGSTTSQVKWTYSLWVKLGDMASRECLLWASSDSGSSDYVEIQFKADRTLNFQVKGDSGTTAGVLEPTRLFRDPGAWYHLVFVWDSENASAGDRMKIYVNGTEETVFNTDNNPADGDLSPVLTSGVETDVGKQTGTTHYFDGYMAEVALIDGQAYAASDFGEFDEDSPTIWKPKNISGLTFGTSGFYLDFGDSAALGDDVSGNGNDLTVVNIAAVDQCIDSPTNNFSTLNPLDNFYPGAAFSEGNTVVVTASSPYAPNLSTIAMTAGKWYWEVKPTNTASLNYHLIGVVSTQATAADDELGDFPNDYGYYSVNGYIRSNNSNYVAPYGDTYTDDDIIGVALDVTNSKLYFSKNGVWQDSGDPTSGATGTGAVSITLGPLGMWFAGVCYYGSIATFNANFGNPAYVNTSDAADANGYGKFEYAPPSGYLALCTKNLGSDGG